MIWWGVGLPEVLMYIYTLKYHLLCMYMYMCVCVTCFLIHVDVPIGTLKMVEFKIPKISNSLRMEKKCGEWEGGEISI